MISPSTLAAFSTGSAAGGISARAPVGGVGGVQPARAQTAAPPRSGGLPSIARPPTENGAPNPSLPRGSLLNLTV